MNFELIAVKYKVIQNKKPFQYYLEQCINNEYALKWFITFTGDRLFDFHHATFVDFKKGFDSAEQAVCELEKYINATV